MKRIFITNLIISLTWLPSLQAATQWVPLGPGIQYTRISPSLLRRYANIIAFKVNPKRFQFSIVTAKSVLEKPTAYVDTLGKLSNAIIAINGGYFSQDLKPLGLRVSQHRRFSRKKNISWWGIFYLKNNRARIRYNRSFHYQPSIAFAIQAGPRLVVNNKISSLKPGVAQRSALGITAKGNVIIAVTQNYRITLKQWAQILKDDLNTSNALNLDGGSSSQLYARLGDIRLNVANLKPVTDAIIIKPKSKA